MRVYETEVFTPIGVFLTNLDTKTAVALFIRMKLLNEIKSFFFQIHSIMA